jgi:hypothetical protein
MFNVDNIVYGQGDVGARNTKSIDKGQCVPHNEPIGYSNPKKQKTCSPRSSTKTKKRLQ